MKAARGVIAHILRIIEFVSANDFQRNCLLMRESNCILKLKTGQAGRIRDHSQHVSAEAGAKRRYSILKPQLSQLYATCADPYCNWFTLISKPRLTAPLTPNLFAFPYPRTPRNWLNFDARGMVVEVEISPGT